MSFDEDNPLPPEPAKEPSASASSTPSFEIEPAHSAESSAAESVLGTAASAPGAPSYLEPPRSVLPDDLRVPWNWADIFLLVAVAIGGGILISFAVMAGLSMFGIQVLRLLRESPEKLNQLNVIIQVFLDLGILAYLAAQIRLRFHSPFWRTIGWRPLEPAKISRGAAYIALVLAGFLLSFVVSIASNIFPPQKELPIQALLQDRYTALLFILVAVLVAPVVEETVFRGYLYPVAARSFGKAWGIIVTGTLFGLLHASQLWGGWGQIALLVVVGIALTYVRAVSRSVVASFILHTSYNSLQVLALLISTHGLRHFPAN
jgi:membrane protease YdiL (CAAX protease family)